MGRGGHRYPIEHAEGRELDFASLLWEALFSDGSQQGVRFRSELDGVFLRWRRLVTVLTSYRTSTWNGPSSDLQHLVDSLKSLTIPTRVVYPRPHSTPEIEAEIAERSGIAAAAINEVCGELTTDGIFPVDARWALEWDEVEGVSETARCLRENPDEWISRRSSGQWQPSPHITLPLGAV